MYLGKSPQVVEAFSVSTQPRLIASLAIALTLLSARAQDKPLFHFTEEPGPHSVGLKVVEQYDYARVYRSATDDLGKPYQGERARPLADRIHGGEGHHIAARGRRLP